MIDDQPEEYTAESLKALKVKHESWVDSELQPRKFDPESHIAVHVDNATDIVRIIEGAYGYDFQHDELEAEEEVEELVISFKNYKIMEIFMLK